LQQDVSAEKAKVYAEEGGIDSLVDARLKDKCKQLVDKIIEKEKSEEILQLDETGKD
jgi:hypothetical protein